MNASAKEIQLLGFAFFMGLLGNLSATWLMDVLPEANKRWTGFMSFVIIGVVIWAFINRKTPVKLDAQ